MADVLQVANSRLAMLEAETEKLRGFIRTAESLMSFDQTESVNVLGGVNSDAEPKESVRAGTGEPKRNTKTTTGNDDTDMPFAEPKALGKMTPPLKEQTNAGASRKNLFRRPEN
jgi:hypothetical protein